ncbi:long-chain fatty acid--CoA ligase [Candidatus Lokiarchaeum ossiferum]|uniref:long-chain fatty acid--CoA ligase n=1 Tax=Candidatus Lokiarchaeum ossiferum TaxID=2951803 RepID=UPI00352EB069
MTLEEFNKNIAIMRYDEPVNLVDVFEQSAKKFPNRKYIGEKDANGEYQWITYHQTANRIDNLRSGIASLGIINEGDAIGIIRSNCKEWAICANATYGLNCKWIPMYEKELPQIWKYIIKDAEIKILFVSNKEIYEQVKTFQDEISTLEKIFVIDGNDENSMAALEKKGETQIIPSKKPSHSDVAALIYTSGTTGDPKGVILTHGNFTSNCQAGRNGVPHLNETARALSILPWAHSYAFTAELNTFTLLGASIGITSVESMSEDLTKANPTTLICVPRLFNKIYDGIHVLMDKEGGIKKKLFYAAKAAAKKKRETGKSSLKLKVLDKLVFSKVRARFGTRLLESLTASAKTELEIANFFYDIGLPIYDCYGMTETAPAITLNLPVVHRLGSVGVPIEKVKVVIDTSMVGEGSEDGEIIAYGPNIMQGYHNKPEQTAAVMVEDENGIKGVRTGDLGHLDKDGFLYITGRIKNEFKLQNGKYVHPAAIEQYIKLLPWVANIMIYGDGKPYNVALVVPDMAVAQRYAETMKLSTSPELLIQKPEIQELIGKEIRAHLKGKFGGYEIPRKFVFLTEDFSLENGMLTQTMKLKRRAVLQKYQGSINSLYDEDAM